MSAPKVANAWCRASGISVCVATMLSLSSPRLPLVFLRVEGVLRLERPEQRLVGFGEGNRLDPGHQASSRGAGARRASRRGRRTDGRPGRRRPPPPTPSAAWSGLPAPSSTSITSSIARNTSGRQGPAGHAAGGRGRRQPVQARHREREEGHGHEDEVGHDRLERPEGDEDARRARPGSRSRGRAPRCADRAGRRSPAPRRRAPSRSRGAAPRS